jgi:hypothetical protein
MFEGKKVIRKVLLIVYSLALFCAFTTSSFANYFSGGKPSGIFAVQYDSSVGTYGYTGTYDTARGYWNGITSKVNVTWTGSSANTTDKYYVGTTTDPTLFGQTSFFKASGSTFVPALSSETWAYSTVAIYQNTMDAWSFSPAQKISNAAHEVGHSLSLDHTPSSGSSSIMKMGIQSIAPTTYDITQLKAKWGV